MNDKLQKKLSTLERMIAIQKDCIHPGDQSVQYMHGMANGLICAYAVIADCTANFVSVPKKQQKRKVRHKSCRTKNNE